jgi:hypothetical protein
MLVYIYFFDLLDIAGEIRRVAFPAYSKQMAWAAVAAYVACHTLNPAIKGINLVAEKKIVEIASNNDEISQKLALEYLADPRAYPG